MGKNNFKILKMHEALKVFGGFVRYYDTTEPLDRLAEIAASGPCDDILACCGGGNQALTILGAAGDAGSLYAVDINAAQLFVLAGKCHFLENSGRMPSFAQLECTYSGRISSVKRDMRCFEGVQLYHRYSERVIDPPESLVNNYFFILSHGMFVLPDPGLFWMKDDLFLARVKKRINCVRFVNEDIFNVSDFFQPGSFDLIYLSDIYWQEKLDFYQFQLARLADLLRPGGRIISYLDPGDDFIGKGISPGQIFLEQAEDMALMVTTRENNGYLVFERMRRRQ